MITRMRHRQQGQVFLIFALAAVALFGVAGLAIDGGRALMDQRNLQNAVDGASLTGANDLGPGTDAQSQANAMDDSVYSLEQSLSISFSSNYGGLGHRLLGQQCGRAACYSGNPTGPYNASNAASPCCINWLDSTGQYTLNITTPYSFGGTTDPEAFIKVDLVHQLPVLIAGNLVPNINVHVQSTARNYAIPYAIFTFKWNDPNAINEAGAAGGLTATKRIGTNGTASMPTGGSGSLTFTCPGGKYGGDLWTLRALPGASPITAGSVSDRTGACPGTASSPQTLSRPVIPPNIHLPDDPCLTSTTANCTGIWAVPEAAISVAATQRLQPTRSSVPGNPIGPRYSSISVTSGATLYLEPGVYYFEGTVASSGLLIQSGGTVATGDCYPSTGAAIPGGCSSTNRSICTAGLTYAGLSTPGANLVNFVCPTDNDWGVLLVFWPAGVDAAGAEAQYPAASGNYFCTAGGSGGTPSAGGLNTLQVIGTATFYVEGSSLYHNVAVYVDPKHASGTTTNFTITAALSAAFTSYCSSNFPSITACMNRLGNGSTVVSVQGGSNTSIVGALFAPQDNSFLGGGSGGKGYGQILNYFIHFQGSGAINEAYNPLALAYSPVIVQ
jgi:hypothetical protein